MRIHDRICSYDYSVSYALYIHARNVLTRNNALIIEWHIFLIHNQATDTLLPVPRGEFVSQFRATRLSNQHLDESLVILCISDHHFVDVSCDRRLVCHGCILVWNRRGLTREQVVVRVGWGLFVDVHVPWIDSFPYTREPVCLNDIIFLLHLSGIIDRGIRKTIKSI